MPSERSWSVGTIREFTEITVNDHTSIIANVVVYPLHQQADEFPHLTRIRRCTTVDAVIAASNLGDPVAFGEGAPDQEFHSPSWWTVMPCVPAYERDCDSEECHCDHERKMPYTHGKYQ
jgi:hypothetical protein